MPFNLEPPLVKKHDAKIIESDLSTPLNISDFLHSLNLKSSGVSSSFGTANPEIVLDGLEIPLLDTGLRIETRSFPEGYSFLYFYSNSLGGNSILTLKYDTNFNQVLKVSPFRSLVEIKYALHPLLGEKSGTIKSVFKALKIDTSLSDEEIAGVNLTNKMRIEKEDRRQKIMEALEKLPKINGRVEEEVAKLGVLVSQGEFAIEKLSDEIRSLRTFALGPCVSLVLYQPNSKIGALYHIDTAGENSSRVSAPILKALSLLSSNGEVNAYIVGGDGSTESKNTIQTIVELLKDAKMIKGVNLNKNTSQNVAIDLDSGLVGSYSGIEQPSDDMRFRLMRAEMNALTGQALQRVGTT